MRKSRTVGRPGGRRRRSGRRIKTKKIYFQGGFRA